MDAHGPVTAEERGSLPPGTGEYMSADGYGFGPAKAEQQVRFLPDVPTLMGLRPKRIRHLAFNQTLGGSSPPGPTNTAG